MTKYYAKKENLQDAKTYEKITGKKVKTLHSNDEGVEVEFETTLTAGEEQKLKNFLARHKFEAKLEKRDNQGKKVGEVI